MTGVCCGDRKTLGLGLQVPPAWAKVCTEAGKSLGAGALESLACSVEHFKKNQNGSLDAYVLDNCCGLADVQEEGFRHDWPSVAPSRACV